MENMSFLKIYNINLKINSVIFKTIYNHGLLLVFVKRIPTDTHDHFVGRSVVHFGPPEIYPGLRLRRQIRHNIFRKVGLNKRYFFTNLKKICILNLPVGIPNSFDPLPNPLTTLPCTNIGWGFI